MNQTHPTDQERASGLRIFDWTCPNCACHTYARVDELKYDDGQENGHYVPGPRVRCVNCKGVWLHPADVEMAQPSPSDDVRGLIDAANESEQELRSIGSLLKRGRYDGPGYMSIPATSEHSANVIAKLREAIARLSTPSSSPVSGEGDEGPLWRHLKAIADQKLPEEIHGDLRPGADWKTGYIECVKIARFAVNSFAPDAPSRPPEPAASGEGGTK